MEDFPVFYCFVLTFYGLLIIPKWLINESGPIAILLHDFGNLGHFQFYGPVDPLLVIKILQTIQITWKHFGKLSFHISSFCNSEYFRILYTTVHQTSRFSCFLFWEVWAENNGCLRTFKIYTENTMVES